MKAGTVAALRDNRNLHWLVYLAAIVSVLVGGSCSYTVKASAITVIYRGTEVLESGQPPFNVYYIDCQPAEGNTNTQVDIEISYGDGTVETRTGLYCNVKLFIDGSLHDGVMYMMTAHTQ